MSFIRPDLLGLAPVAALLLIVSAVALWRRRLALMDAYGGPTAAARLARRRLDRFPVAGLSFGVLAAVLMTLSAAEPEAAVEEVVDLGTPIDLIVVVDVSHSMSAADVGPTRIGRARELLARILEERVADRVALSLFADWPFGLVPLTDDPTVVDFFTPWVAPELVSMRDQGTSLASTLTHAVETWEERPRAGSAPIVLIVSDGESHGAAPEVLESVGAVVDSGLRVWTAGVGTPEGAPLFLPDSDGAPYLDPNGSPVVATFDESLLRDLAEQGGGRFYDISREASLSDLVDDLRTSAGFTEVDEETPGSPVPWLILLALACLAVETILDSGRVARVFGKDARSESAT